MTNPRATKRRRLSDIQSADEDGDIQMQDGSHDVQSAAAINQGGSPVVSKTSQQQQAPRAHLDNAQDTTMIEKDNSKAGGSGTPSRTGLRSSGRQRKPPQRYEDEVLKTPSSIKRSPSSAGANARTPRNIRKTKPMPGTEEIEETPPPPQRETVTRTRSKRVSVRYASTKPQDEDRSVTQDQSRQSSSAEEYQDGLDDLVTMQMQQDLTQHDAIEKEDAMVTSDPMPQYAESLQSLVQTSLRKELQLLAKIVLEKLNGKRLVPLKGLESEYLKVRQLVEQTVTAGEGNSMLLLGSRGCGKTAIVETIISSMRREHKNDFHIIRLNGFLHTDDRLALREMWRQLGRETNTEEEAGKVSSYADTMATLLALLSHPEELFGPSGNPEAVTAAKSIIIILDEFDQFVTHPRQTLLYNLFDIAQARKAPIAVIGLTTKVDVTEMLEKRVKSRFSHRYVYVPLPRSFETFSEICFAGLDLEDSENSGLLDADAAVHSIIESAGWNKLLRGWRSYLQGLWSDEAFSHHLQRIYHQTKSVKEFFTSALLPMTELYHSTHDSSLHIPTPKAFSSQALSCPDPAPLPFSTSTTVSASPSSLPLSLLLAATRLTALYDPGLEAGQPQNLTPLALSFPAAYAEYVRLLTSAKTSASVSGAAVTPGRVWGRDVAREAWEKLVSWGLINPVGGGSGTADGRMFRVEVSFEEVVAMAGSGGSLGKWWRE
ncbi:origin recognition complex subunit 4 [Aspergillus clavatus NRRL 1]|uniref:Origin recognition complex subunit 4 n=1 Tax=Aspergillus clavatus (strain ATCC 1007 / CBS 513.65 / DSM 816 / NCTC 3887 / NRRL 1 / QM 1276 / 107) TaxID=344612 RepID=A1C6G1_ASPCL|nr:origin recognition complex subunit Orc4, putative [Aspergillus clavatus NRRL 1]EAW13982.1 origin recognition complex subunit Orc4, putative [Aspergillus clavatus NRRL 1]